MDLCKRAICAFNQQTNKPHRTRSLTFGCHGNTPPGFIPLLSRQHMRVWQRRVMSFFDFYLLQPHKHRLTLISVLNAPPCKASESGPCVLLVFLAFFPYNIPATCCPPFVTRTQGLHQVMASRGLAVRLHHPRTSVVLWRRFNKWASSRDTIHSSCLKLHIHEIYRRVLDDAFKKVIVSWSYAIISAKGFWKCKQI